jgi:membrane protein implicated in regulation of membrane protease activity
MIGIDARVVQKDRDSYLVLAHGERWEAVSKESFEVDDIATVESIDGLTLKIKHKE